MSSYDLVSVGRACLDLYAREIGLPLPEVQSFAAYVGGCPANIAVGATRLGLRVAMVSAVGDDPVGEFVERFFAGDRIDQALVRLIRELRARGYRVGLLSNAPPGRAANSSPAGRWGMEDLFDAQVFSYQVGALKPDPRTYQAILNTLGVKAQEALFVDDSPANVAGARAAGMAAVRFVGTTALMEELRKEGLV